MLEPILAGIGMFTRGTIWILTHGQLDFSFLGPSKMAQLVSVFGFPKPNKKGDTLTKNRGQNQLVLVESGTSLPICLLGSPLNNGQPNIGSLFLPGSLGQLGTTMQLADFSSKVLGAPRSGHVRRSPVAGFGASPCIDVTLTPTLRKLTEMPTHA